MALARKPFVVLDAEILSSSVWSEAAHVRLVWITLLILCDTEGYVGASVPGIARAAGVTLEQAIEAMERLQQPDEHSRTKTSEGRRLELADRGWRVLNFLEHLDRLSSERVKARERVRMHRKRKADKAKKQRKTNRNVTVRSESSEKGPETREELTATDSLPTVERLDGAMPLSPSQESVTDTEPGGRSSGLQPVPADQRDEYIRAVFDAFRAKAGLGDLWYPPGQDRGTVLTWMDRGVPLRVVLQGIAETRGNGRLLAYYESAVRQEFERQQLAVSGTR